MELDYRAFGARVRQLRHQRQMSQADLAREVGLSVSFMGHIERGTRIASVSTLYALSIALDTTADYLIRGDQTLGEKELTNNQIRVLREMRRAFDEDWLKE